MSRALSHDERPRSAGVVQSSHGVRAARTSTYPGLTRWPPGVSGFVCTGAVAQSISKVASYAATGSPAMSRVIEGATFMPGPVVDANAIEWMYRPLAADGLARMISSITAA